MPFQRFLNSTRVMYARGISVLVLKHADTTTVRVLLANASILWAVFLFIEPATFNRNGYQIMKVMASEWVWASLFILHGIGVYWRVYDPVARPTWALVVNTLGCAVWMVSTLAFNLALGRITPTSAMEWTLCAASAWSLLRTGLTKESVTP